MKNYYKARLSELADKTDWDSKRKRLDVASQSVKDFPDTGEFHAEYGEALAQWHLYKSAADELSQALKFGSFDKKLLTRSRYFNRLASKADKLTVSACAIMRNEIEHVENWLTNVRVFANEIIVVDTGSDDGTIELLKNQSDVRLVEYKWNDDFSAAKNQAMERAIGDWIIFTDADEYFYHPESLRGWLALVQSEYQDSEAALVLLRNVDADNNDELLGDSNIVRIFKNHCGIAYRGTIHEQPFKSDGAIKYIQADGALTLRHVGYSGSVIRRKHERNLSLLLEEVENGSDPAMYYGFLAECYFGLQQYEKALENAICAYKSPYRSIGVQDGLYIIAVNAMNHLGLSVTDKFTAEEADDICHNALLDCKWNLFTLMQWLSLHADEELDSLLEKLAPLYFQSKEDILQLLGILEENGFLALAYHVRKIKDMLTKDVEALYNLYRSWQKYPAEKVTANILANVMSYTNLLSFCLIAEAKTTVKENAWCDKQMNFLPEVYQNIIKSFGGQSASAVLDVDAYFALLDYVLIYGDEQLVGRYLALSAGMSGQDIVCLGNKLLSLDRYAQALECYGRIQAGDEAVTAEFWFNCGKCFYFLHDYEKAMAAFGEVENVHEHSAEMDAYIKWCKEVERDENIGVCDSQG